MGEKCFRKVFWGGGGVYSIRIVEKAKGHYVCSVEREMPRIKEKEGMAALMT